MAENTTYDLVLMDVMLPKKDGLSAIRELREKKKLPLQFFASRQRIPWMISSPVSTSAVTTT